MIKIHAFARSGHKIGPHSRCQRRFRGMPLFFFNFPVAVGIHDRFGVRIAFHQECQAVRNLRQRSVNTKLPHGCGNEVVARAQKWSQVESLVSPMRKVSAGRAFADALSIGVELETIVGAHQHDEFSRLRSEMKHPAKMHNLRFSQRNLRMRDPVGVPLGPFPWNRLAVSAS